VEGVRERFQGGRSRPARYASVNRSLLLLTRSLSASALKSLASGRYAYVSRSLLLLNRSLLTRVYLHGVNALLHSEVEFVVLGA
jgi:hypothetical protein